MRIFLLLILGFTFTSCDSKLVTLEDAKLEEQAKDVLDPDSSVNIIENTGTAVQVTCSPKNAMRVVITQNSKKGVLLCKDSTKVDSNYNLGPVCTGGVSIAAFTPSSQWVPCEAVTVCGKTPDAVVELKNTESAKMYQSQYSQLPWGCKGSIEVQQKTTGQTTLELPVDVKPPECPTCDVTKTKTCAVCGVDVTPPTIIDVFTESFKCNSIRIIVFASDANAGIHETGYSFDGGVTWQADSAKDFVGLSLNLAINKVRVRDRSGNISQYGKALAATSSPCPCATPWGETIQHGESRMSYKASTVQCTTTCEASSLQRTCNNGVLSGGAEFKANSCSVTGCPQCQLPWGEKIDHGVSVDAYNKSSAPCAGECLKATLSCDRGVLKGDAATYKSKACSYVKEDCSCTHAGVKIASGQTKTVFSSSQVACGSTCQAGSVTCTSGTLTGNSTYTNLGCSPKVCKCTTAWGQQIDLNTTVDAYKKSTISCSEAVSCTANNNFMKIKCTDVVNNVLSVVEGTGNIADYKESGCAAASCGCTHLGVVFKPTDPSLKVYKINEAISPAKCDLAGNSGLVKCTASGANFNLSGDTNTAVFKYTQCKDLPVPGTGTGTGQSPIDVGVGVGGGAGGGIGDSEGDGEGFRRKFVTPGGGAGCDINSPPYYCWGASSGISTTASFCLLPGVDGYSAANTNNQDFKQRISIGGTVTAYSQKTVTCGDSCSKYMGLVSCDHGIMSGKTKYKYLDCREVCP